MHGFDNGYADRIVDDSGNSEVHLFIGAEKFCDQLGSPEQRLHISARYVHLADCRRVQSRRGELNF
jgi:hypothetical protein